MNSCPIFDFFNSSFISAATGGLIAGLLTFWGVKRTIENEKQKSKESADAEVRAFCQAILTELEAILARYLVSVGDTLGKSRMDQPFLFYYPVFEEYFTIFNSNAQMIGKIKDDKLRSEIVLTYTKAKGLLDSLRYNNNLVLQYQDFFSKARQTKLPYDEQQKDLFLTQLRDYAPNLITQHSDFITSTERLIRDLKKQIGA